MQTILFYLYGVCCLVFFVRFLCSFFDEIHVLLNDGVFLVGMFFSYSITPPDVLTGSLTDYSDRLNHYNYKLLYLSSNSLLNRKCQILFILTLCMYIFTFFSEQLFVFSFLPFLFSPNSRLVENFSFFRTLTFIHKLRTTFVSLLISHTINHNFSTVHKVVDRFYPQEG